MFIFRVYTDFDRRKKSFYSSGNCPSLLNKTYARASSQYVCVCVCVISCNLIKQNRNEHKNEYSQSTVTLALFWLPYVPPGLLAWHWYSVTSFLLRLFIVRAFVVSDPPVYFVLSISMFPCTLLTYFIHCILLSSGPVTVQFIVTLPLNLPETLSPVITVSVPVIEFENLLTFIVNLAV